MIKTKPERTVLYLRESKDDELGIARHRDDLLKLCTRMEWTVAEEYIDNAQSATRERRTTPRPAYTRMLADAADGKVTRILVWHADRLVRDNRDAEDIIDLCNEHGIELWTRDSHLELHTDSGRTVFRILTGVARGEIERKSGRTKAAMEQRAAMGPAWWPSRPFGYRLKDESILAARTRRKLINGEMVTIVPKWAAGEVILDRQEADAIRAAYTSVIAGGSLKYIARDWNSKGIVTPKGGQWTSMAIRQLLINPRNAALRVYWPKKKGEKGRKFTDIVNHVVGKGEWPAIVTEQVWRSAVAVLTDPARLTPGAGFSAPRKYLLSGLARCGVCGGTLTSAIPSNTTNRPVYSCKRPGCGKVRRSQADVDNWVRGHVIVALARDLDVLTAKQDIDTSELLARLQEIEGEKNQAAAMIQSKAISLPQLTIINAGFDKEITSIRARMQDAEKTAALDEFIGVEDAATVFDNLGLDRKRAVIRLLCTVAVHPGQKPRRPFDEDLVVVTPNY